jgi:hypothetical protein
VYVFVSYMCVSMHVASTGTSSYASTSRGLSGGVVIEYLVNSTRLSASLNIQ